MKNIDLGNYLTELRTTHGYSQNYLSKELGIGRQAYSHYETGRNMPPYHTIVKLAELYGVSTNNFFEKMNLSEEQWVELAAGYKIVKSYMGR